MSVQLKAAFMRGFSTENNSQDNANDNLELRSWTRRAFEVGAYFMRAGLDGNAVVRVEKGHWYSNRPTLFVDGANYTVTDTPGGCRVDHI